MDETRSVAVRLSMEASQYIREAQKAGKVGEDAMQRIERSARSADQALEQIGGTAGRAALGGFAALLATGKAAMDWESAWAGVTKTVDGTAAQMAELETGLRDLAKRLPATHDEIAAVAEAAGQLGVAREDILSFTETMIALAETTNLTADEAATSIAQLANVMGTSGDDIDNLGAALVALGNDGASTERDIIQMAQRISAAGALIGLAESDVLALANAAASMGVEVEAGGSAISRSFIAISKATKQGGAKLDLFAETAGMSSAKFVKAFEQDPARAFAAFTGGLDRINQSGGDVFTLLDQLGLSDVRVSQALLGMAASGDMLTESLDLGARAWDENTALAIEAAKRYDTTAAQAEVSWNRIKDAGIDAGESMLPVITEVADAVGTIADAFGALPGPVQSAFVKLAALGTLTAGGLWLGIAVTQKIQATRQAMTDLAVQSPKTAGALGKVGKAAGIAAIAVTGLDLAIGMTTKSDPVAGLEKTTKAILDLSGGADGAKAAVDGLFSRETTALGGPLEMKSQIDGLSDAFAALETHWAKKIWSDPLFMDSDWDLATQSFQQLDLAMSNLVSTGNAEAAAEMFAYFTETAKDAGLTSAEAAALLPGYADALLGVENQTRGTAAETEGLGGAMTTAEQAAADFKDTLEQLNAVLSGRAAVRDYEAALDDFTDSIVENGNTFDINTAAGRANQAQLDAIAETALRVAEGMGAADRQRFLTAAIEDLRTAGKQFDVPQSEVKTLIALLREADRASVNPSINVNTNDAMTRLSSLQAAIDRMYGNTVTITVKRVDASGVDFISGGGTRRARGGPVYGPGTATSDSIPAYLSNGEYVVKAAAVQKYGVHMFDGLNAMRYAEGGPVGRRGGRDDDRPMKSLERRLKELTRAIEKDTKQRDDLRRQRDSVRDAARGSFNNDIFGNGLAGLKLQLAADTNDANAMNKALKGAKKKGLDGALLDALSGSGDLDTAQQLRNLSRREIAALERSFARRTQAQNALGATAAAPYNKELRELNRELKQQRAQQRRLEAAIKRLGKDVEKGAREGVENRTKAQAQKGRISVR